MNRVLFAAIAALLLAACSRDDYPPAKVHSVDAFSDPATRRLADAAASGNIAQIERSLKEGVKIDATGRLGVTAAWWAIRNRNEKGFAYLLAHGADPNPDVDSITIMEMAAGYEDPEFLETVLRYKPNLNLVSRDTDEAPIDVAITYQRTRNLDMLIKAGADVNVHTETADYPIYCAIYVKRYDYVLKLLQAGADPRKTCGKFITLEGQIGNGYLDPNSDAYVWRERVIRYLRKQGMEVHKPPHEGKRTKPLPPDLR